MRESALFLSATILPDSGLKLTCTRLCCTESPVASTIKRTISEAEIDKSAVSGQTLTNAVQTVVDFSQEELKRTCTRKGKSAVFIRLVI